MNPGFAGYSLLCFAFLTVNLSTGPYKFAMSPLCSVTDWNFNAGVRLCGVTISRFSVGLDIVRTVNQRMRNSSPGQPPQRELCLHSFQVGLG